MSDTSRNYELAFHINQNLEESRIMSIANELKDALIKGLATITFTKEPERQRLSYDIKHNAGSFFGYIQFNTENPEGLAGIEEYIKLNNDILRSLIVRLPSDAQKSQTLERQLKAKERLEKRAQAATKAAPSTRPSADGKKLDKEVEDIIEKL